MSRFPHRSDGTAVTNTYHATGERQRTSGSRTYPVESTYDHAGRMKTMKTWRNFASDTGAALTTWNYSAQRGFLLSKQYADSQGPTYTYTAAGRLATRTWARGITTYYAYNPAGDLASVNYDDNLTPGITHTYDRRGRRLTAGSAGGPPAVSLTYNVAGQITSETLATGLSLTNTYDSLLRRSGLAAIHHSSFLLHTFGYDSASRLESVSDGTNTATSTYVANSPLVSQIAFTQSGQPRMTTTKQYDALNRLTSIVSLPQTPSPRRMITTPPTNVREQPTPTAPTGFTNTTPSARSLPANASGPMAPPSSAGNSSSTASMTSATARPPRTAATRVVPTSAWRPTPPTTSTNTPSAPSPASPRSRAAPAPTPPSP